MVGGLVKPRMRICMTPKAFHSRTQWLQSLGCQLPSSVHFPRPVHPDLRPSPTESVVTWFDKQTKAFCLRKYITVCHSHRHPSIMFHEDFDGINKEALTRVPRGAKHFWSRVESLRPVISIKVESLFSSAFLRLQKFFVFIISNSVPFFDKMSSRYNKKLKKKKPTLSYSYGSSHAVGVPQTYNVWINWLWMNASIFFLWMLKEPVLQRLTKNYIPERSQVSSNALLNSPLTTF